MCRILFIVGTVETTDERVLSCDGQLPIDGTVVWRESEPGMPMLLEDLEELHPIVWIAEPEPYGVWLP